MVLRKVLLFNTILGITLPKEFTNALNISHGSYVEVFLRDKQTIIVKPHGTKPNKITVND